MKARWFDKVHNNSMNTKAAIGNFRFDFSFVRHVTAGVTLNKRFEALSTVNCT